jgi:hypothetical protein
MGVHPAQRRYEGRPGEPEIDLPKGDVTEGVVRVGGTVRRPHQPQSLAVAGYLDHLERTGFDASPRYLGRDARGRDVLTYLPGDVAGDPPDAWSADEHLLASVGRLLRRLHDASAGYRAAEGLSAEHGSVWHRDLVPVPALPAAAALPPPELVSHLDVTQQNVVVRDGEAAGLVDFDMAGPTSRVLDVFKAAMYWVPLRPPEDLWPTWAGVEPAPRLRIFADGLGADDRQALVDVAIALSHGAAVRMRASAEHLGGGWARMWEAGVGTTIERRRLWLEEQRGNLLRALAVAPLA